LVYRLAFALVAVGYVGGSASWLVTSAWARTRAQDLERRGGHAAHWRSLAAKDGLTAVLFLCLGAAAVSKALDGKPTPADLLLALAVIPLAFSLAWTVRFMRFARNQADEAEFAQRQRERSDQETAFTRRLAGLLGAADVKLPSGVVVRSVYQPAEGILGGDFLAVTTRGQQVLLVVGDVAGHGFGAAIQALRLKDLLVSSVRTSAGLAEALAQANAYLCTVEGGESLATVFVACYEEGRVRYVSVGHLPGVLVGHDEATELGPTGPLLGLSATTEVAEVTVSLPPGHRLLVFTDGLLDAYGAKGGLEIEKVRGVARTHGLAGLLQTVQALRHEALRDDIAIVELSRPADTAPRSRHAWTTR
jgi:Stage II sporulation protein E (SpoIIE)